MSILINRQGATNAKVRGNLPNFPGLSNRQGAANRQGAKSAKDGNFLGCSAKGVMG